MRILPLKTRGLCSRALTGHYASSLASKGMPGLASTHPLSEKTRVKTKGPCYLLRAFAWPDPKARVARIYSSTSSSKNASAMSPIVCLK